MAVPKSVFVIFMTILASFWICIFSWFKFNLGESKVSTHNLRKQAQVLKLLEKENFRLSYQVLDLHQGYALKFASMNKPQKKMETIRGGLRRPAGESVNFESSEVMFRRAQELFAKAKYKASEKELDELLERFPLSSRRIEALFLKLEISFLLENYKKTLDLSDVLLDHFPESVLTQYALLRVAEVSELNGQPQESHWILQELLREASSKELKNEVERRLNRLRTL